MYLLDKIKEKLTPNPSNAPISTTASGGIGNRRGTLGFEDDVSIFCFFARRIMPALLPERVPLNGDPSQPFYVTMFISC